MPVWTVHQRGEPLDSKEIITLHEASRHSALSFGSSEAGVIPVTISFDIIHYKLYKCGTLRLKCWSMIQTVISSIGRHKIHVSERTSLCLRLEL
jgi:hypothetical protein